MLLELELLLDEEAGMAAAEVLLELELLLDEEAGACLAGTAAGGGSIARAITPEPMATRSAAKASSMNKLVIYWERQPSRTRRPTAAYRAIR